MPIFSNRIRFLFIALLCAYSLAYAYYAQFYLGQEPCPLCIVQRVILAAIGLLALIYAIHNPQNWLSRLYGVIITGFAIFGIKVAAHHVWLTNLPADQQPLSCGMPLDVLYDQLPLTGFIHKILQGDAECAKVKWLVFGMSAPAAVIVLCSIIILVSLTVIFKKKKTLPQY
jgi:disulfide bond formation protein DsbB